MKFKDKYQIAPEFEDLFSFASKEEELEHEAKMIMFRFLSEIEKISADKPIKKKELAKAINTSASYVTQLYQGSKLINLLTLAKIQDFYDVSFEIKAKKNSENYKDEIDSNYHFLKSFKEWNKRNRSYEQVINTPNYLENNVEQPSKIMELEVA